MPAGRHITSHEADGGSPSLLARFLSTMRAELQPGDAEAELTLAKMRLAQANMRVGMRTMPILTAMCGLIHLQWAPIAEVAAWMLATFAFTAFRIRAERAMPRPGASAERVRKAARFYMLHSTVFILCWASQGALFWQSGDLYNQMIITIILLSSAMSATLTASWLYAPLSQIAIYIGSVAVLYALEGTQQAFVLAAMAIVYANFIANAIANLHSTAVRILTLESEKDSLIADLRHADKAKSDFLANMSHELRTPLNAILGFSEVMRDEMMGPMHNKAYKSYAGDIHSSGQHLLGLVNDILDLAKIESGKLELNDDSFTMQDIVSEGIRLFELQAAQKRVRFVPSVDASIMLRWDLRAAKQIAINLLSNALKFTPENSEIHVTAGMREDGGCYVTVRDSGGGIAEEDRHVIFESFGQGRHDVATSIKGTGLGLAIVKALVELHGGGISVTSPPGEGAAFTIEVPANRVSRVSMSRSAA